MYNIICYENGNALALISRIREKATDLLSMNSQIMELKGLFLPLGCSNSSSGGMHYERVGNPYSGQNQQLH